MTVRPAAQRLDLRKTDVPDVLARVKAALQAAVCDEGPETYVRKRRSIGFRTERNTWVRIECRGRERLDGQAWGLESAAAIREVPIPTWHAGLSWLDTERDVMWRADETAYIDQAPIGRASNAPGLPPSWWAACNAALGELARHPTARNATPDLEPINAARVGAAITKVFPECAQVSLDEWTTAHADLNWANMTGPTLWILDWEDWGRAPAAWTPPTCGPDPSPSPRSPPRSTNYAAPISRARPASSCACSNAPNSSPGRTNENPSTPRAGARPHASSRKESVNRPAQPDAALLHGLALITPGAIWEAVAFATPIAGPEWD